MKISTLLIAITVYYNMQGSYLIENGEVKAQRLDNTVLTSDGDTYLISEDETSVFGSDGSYCVDDYCSSNDTNEFYLGE